MGRCRIISVAGGTASGKTTLARDLQRIGGQERVQVIPLDAYYRDWPGAPLEKRALNNYDHPDAFEVELLREHLRSLVGGAAVEIPVYDFALHARSSAETQTVSATDVVIVEGILAMHFPVLREVYSYSIFVDAPDHLRFERRLSRDVRERGRTEESVVAQWNETVHPMHVQFCAPTLSLASEVVSGERWDDATIERLWVRIVAALE
jgi:uridine kinase